MQSFAKALWNVLKQYKEKLKVIQSLKISGSDLLFFWYIFLQLIN